MNIIKTTLNIYLDILSKKKEVILVIRKFLMLVGTFILIATSINPSISLAQGAETVNSNENTPQPESEISVSQMKEVKADHGDLLKLNEQIYITGKTIQDYQNQIAAAQKELEVAAVEIQGLEAEIKLAAENIEKRNDVLKERALSYQQNGHHASYIEVLLGSSSFGDLINRADSVAKIMEADQNLVDQQEAALKEYEAKKLLLDTKVAEITAKKADLEKMLAQATEKQKQLEILMAQVKQENAKLESEKAYIPKTDGGYAAIVTTIGKKYIGKSTYVFGGGRTASDIARGRFDCSAFVHWAFAQAGIEVGSSTATLRNSGTRVSVEEMRAGDLVFFDTYKKDGHVGIYLGGGKFIGSQSSSGVAIADMTTGYWKQKFKGKVIRI